MLARYTPPRPRVELRRGNRSSRRASRIRSGRRGTARSSRRRIDHDLTDEFGHRRPPFLVGRPRLRRGSRSRPVVQKSSRNSLSFRISSGRAWYRRRVPSRRSLTSPAARSTPRCCEIAERVTPLKCSAISVAGSSRLHTSRRISRRRGSAIALRAASTRICKHRLTLVSTNGWPTRDHGGVRILYLDIDTLRADHLGCAGYHRDTTPNIDALAADGVRFANVYASDVPCLPSRTALITGAFGIRNGVVNHGGAAADLRSLGARREFVSRWAVEFVGRASSTRPAGTRRRCRAFRSATRRRGGTAGSWRR